MKNYTLSWFSCGVTSAVATKLALSMFDNVRIVYIDTGSCHVDNMRFIEDCSKWFGKSIEIIKSPYYANIYDVFHKHRFVNSPFGAPCTLHLKKNVRKVFEKENPNFERQIFGFDFSLNEVNRAVRFKQQNPSAKPFFPLIERKLTKEECMGLLLKADIEIPTMYKLGYSNNNCIGCVKGGISYWNKIRVDFPQYFNKMAEMERYCNGSCLKDDNGPIFLDELDPERGLGLKPILPSCSLFCDIEFADIIDTETMQIMNV